MSKDQLPSFEDAASISSPWGPLQKLAEDFLEFKLKMAEIEADLAAKLVEIEASYTRFDLARAEEAAQFNEHLRLAQLLVEAARLSGDSTLVARASDALIYVVRDRPQLMRGATAFVRARGGRSE